MVKSGAVYVPVDPSYPQDRLDFILADCDAKLVLRTPVRELAGYRSDDPTDADRIRPLRPDNTAYLIYTSGTTGLPKGVAVPHRPVAEYFVWFKGEYDVDDTDRLLQVASPSFDVSIAEIFGTLACGARMVIPRPGDSPTLDISPPCCATRASRQCISCRPYSGCSCRCRV